jgi:uncharacterized protein (TIGR00369 family)
MISSAISGILHGGVISSVLDMAGGMLVMAAALEKTKDLENIANTVGKCSTIDLQVSYLRPGLGELFTAKAWLQKTGHKISFTRMELYNESETLIATASGTYLQG